MFQNGLNLMRQDLLKAAQTSATKQRVDEDRNMFRF